MDPLLLCLFTGTSRTLTVARCHSDPGKSRMISPHDSLAKNIRIFSLTLPCHYYGLCTSIMYYVMYCVRLKIRMFGNKMPTRCNRGFYCRSYCMHNMFRAPLCPSSGAQEYYTVVAACGISCCGFQVAGLVWSWGLCVRFAGANRTPGLQVQTGHITLSSTPDQELENHSTKYHRQQPLYNTLELLMMGIVVPETCWASNKICNKNLCCI